MKIYWHSTAPWSPSSYSVLTNRVVPDLVRDGHKVTLGVWYGLQGRPLPWQIMGNNGQPVDTVQVLPYINGNDYASGLLRQNYEYTRADLIITCSDVWVFGNKLTAGLNFAPWLPIDHDPVPKPIIEALQSAMYPMVYSKWGTQLLQDSGVDAHYVPCSAPANVFTPGDKTEARKLFEVKRKYDFLVTMVAANKDPSDRKGFNEALQGFAKFAESHDGAVLYLHTNWSGPIAVGNIAKALGIEDRVVQPDQYAYGMGLLDETYMRNVYRASDVLLNPAKSEGFGLPLVEAQMCGCPIAASDFSTTDELLFAGWKIGGQPDWSLGAESWRLRVFVDSVVDVLNEAYINRDNDKLRQKAINGSKRYDTSLVYNHHWKPALTDIAKLLERNETVYAMA